MWRIFRYSGVLKNVQQIGVEFHHVTTRIRSYFEILQGLYELGYKVTMDDRRFRIFRLNRRFGLRNLMFFAHLGDRIRPKPFDKAGRGRGLGQVRLLRDRVEEGRREIALQDNLGGEEPTANGHRRRASPIKSPRDMCQQCHGQKINKLQKIYPKCETIQA